jgi:ABC-type polysaccharide/polyol phosphate transport system ATPase subunit
MNSDLAIKIENLSVRYTINIDNKITMKNALMRASRGERVKTKVVEAVNDLSLEVKHGTVLGIVGANGAGKSTLMRTIAGILPPTKGRVSINGKVSTLLALGVGFNQSLSGRDNIILGGLAAGMTLPQISEKTEEIAKFADLPEGFLDVPVRTYSAGMYSRVAFSVAVNISPDILLLDEALSTGDATFKEKSFNRLRELCNQARTILIVSHALSSLNELCDSVLWLHQGRIREIGKPEQVTDNYLKFLNVGKTSTALEDL